MNPRFILKIFSCCFCLYEVVLKLPTAAAAFFVPPSRGGSGRADLIGRICDGRSVSDFCSKNATPKAAKLTLAAQLGSDPLLLDDVGAEEDAPPSGSTRQHDQCRNIRFLSPLLEYGYRPAVDEYYHEAHEALSLHSSKPLLLYLPGFDGGFLSIFLQFPELGTIFDVRCLTVATDDRSTFDELRNDVIRYLRKQHHHASDRRRRPVYLAGESFGGLLACEVANALLQDPEREKDQDTGRIDLKGLTLINPATSFDRSVLAVEGPKAGDLPPWLYPLGLLKMLPLFTDEFSGEQLLLILQAKALPSVIDNATREAYMGRVALSLPFVIPFMAQETLKWRLSEWLETGCARLAADHNTSLLRLDKLRTLIVVGEKDNALPSLEEADRLSKLWLDSAAVHVVPDAGHASTCGSRVDLAALLRGRFPELQSKESGTRTAMKEVASRGTGAYFGMEPRYDNGTFGLSPLEYWSSKFYRKYKPRSEKD